MLVNIYIDTENQIPRKQPHRYGYVIEAEGYEDRTVSGFGEADETFNGTVLTALLAALGRIRAKCELRICLRNSRIGRDLIVNMPKWRQNGWTCGSGRPVATAELWKKVDNRIRELKISNIVFENMDRHARSSWIQAEIKRQIIT